MMDAADPFTPLTDEHRLAIAFLDEMRIWAEQMDEERACRSGTNPYRVAQASRRVTEFDNELEVHFRKEEDALFPVIERHIPREGGPLGVMLDEHTRLRELRRRLVSLAPGAEEGSGVAAFEKVANELDDLLRNHIDKEDNILFPLGRSVLTEAECREAFARMQAVAMPASR